MPEFRLTDAQQAVVQHNVGPALVFAVAGAGKTTAMVHRIERLVREGVFPASQILATSFGKGNERDLQEKLTRWPYCRAVHVRTLHALGRHIIGLAQRAGYWRHLRMDSDDDEDFGVEQKLLNGAIAEARRRRLPYAPELESLDRQDFLSYVSACKGNLCVASLEQMQLPQAAASLVREATAPRGSLAWYLDLYRLFEEVRLTRGDVTFADMLMTGWETLVRYPDVRQLVQESFRCVLVDEYQDINLAQSEMLDLITAPERNYMAIGDDDQTIYEWRGANPRFILGFAHRYQAKTYVIDDNFRCPVGPLLFANRVIAHNRRRAKKQLQLTRGFEGEIELNLDRNPATMAARVVDKMKALRREGYAWQEMAVLVRLNAQTPHVEQALINADIPFRVSKPFYERLEIKTLIYYVRMAWVERSMQTNRELTPRQKLWFKEAWQAVYNRPKRYLSRDLHDYVQHTVLRKGVAPTAALRLVAPQASHDGIVESIERLADDLAWLAARLKSDAAETLREFERRLNYKQYLRESSGFPETGQGRATGVDAFIDYARGKGSVLAFVAHIRELAREKTSRERASQADAVTISTIHAAKGLEWPVVFVIHCNQNSMPFNGGRADGEQDVNLEEERRLFYVALTRSSQHLYLHAVKQERLSQFLREADWRELLPTVHQLQQIVARDPELWRAQEAWTLARNVAEHYLGTYFSQWWDAPAERKAAAGHAMGRFFSAVEAHQAWQPLGLRREAVELWQPLAPEEVVTGNGDFPGLQALLPKDKGDSFARENFDARPQTLARSPATPEMIKPHMWVHCDAGWGRVERIIDGDGQLLARAPGGMREGVLIVTLRPGLDALEMQIDLTRKRILFPQGGTLFTCTRCRNFSSSDVQLVTRQHNNVAHDGVGASYKPETRRELPLRKLNFHNEGPDNQAL